MLSPRSLSLSEKKGISEESTDNSSTHTEQNGISRVARISYSCFWSGASITVKHVSQFSFNAKMNSCHSFGHIKRDMIPLRCGKYNFSQHLFSIATQSFIEFIQRNLLLQTFGQQWILYLPQVLNTSVMTTLHFCIFMRAVACIKNSLK